MQFDNFNFDNFKNVDSCDIKSVLQAGDLDWDLVSTPSLFKINGKLHTSQNQHILIDKGEGGIHHLAVVGRDYKVISPKDLINTALSLSNSFKWSFKGCGHTQNGRYIYALSEESRTDSFIRCHLFSTCNDGNGKTRIHPVLLNTFDGSQMFIVDQKSGLQLGYSLSHHYDYSIDEAIDDITEFKNTAWAKFEEYFQLLSSVKPSAIRIDEFHHRVAIKLKPASKNSKMIYESLIDELKSNHRLRTKEHSDTYKDTMAGLYLSICTYIDLCQSRKSSVSGRIHSINFGRDEVFKRNCLIEAINISRDILEKND